MRESFCRDSFSQCFILVAMAKGGGKKSYSGLFFGRMMEDLTICDMLRRKKKKKKTFVGWLQARNINEKKLEP